MQDLIYDPFEQTEAKRLLEDFLSFEGTEEECIEYLKSTNDEIPIEEIPLLNMDVF